MAEELTKVKLTIHLPFDKPNKNGCILTEDAVEDAVNHLQRNLPIIYENDKVIGTTTGESHIVTWDDDNQVCKMTVDGVLFDCSPKIVIKENEDGKISNFQIASISLNA